jgi:hypothetical protein
MPDSVEPTSTRRHRFLVIGFAKGERPDEQAHREADPGQDAGAVEGAPAGAGRQIGPAAADRQRRRAEDADLLTKEQDGGLDQRLAAV